MPRVDSCRRCWHHRMLPGQHEDWASSPVTLSTRRKERGTAGSCYVPTHQPPPTLVLKDANSLLTSGTGVAVATHVALSGGYIWNNININRGFHPGTAQSCQVKNEGEHTSVQGTQASMFLDYIHFCYQDTVKLEKLSFHSKTWSLTMYFSNFTLMQIFHPFTSLALIWSLIWRNGSY